MKRPLQRTPKQRYIPIDLMVCEGETEVDYFKVFARYLRLHVEIKKSKGSDPLSIVKTAGKFSKDYDEVFCVFDKDYHDANFNSAIELCLKQGFIPIVSNPCFELWFLLHFFSRQSALGGPEETLKALQKHLPEYEKDGLAAFYETYPKVTNACKNASKLSARENDQFHQDPYTNVDLIVQRFRKIESGDSK